MTTPHEHMPGSDVAAGTERRKPRIPTCANPIWQGAIRQPAVAGTFYPADPDALRGIIDRQLDYARTLLDHHHNLLSRLPQGVPKAIIAPHAGYVYSGTTAALAYSLLARGRGQIRRAVIIGPTHRVPVDGTACCTAGSWRTPLGTVPLDTEAECAALDADTPGFIVNDDTHRREHAVEVHIPWIQRVLGPQTSIIPLNAGDTTPGELGILIDRFWTDPATVVIISSDLSHYHPEHVARQLDDDTIARITAGILPIVPDYACGAYPINGLIDVCRRRGLTIRPLGCSTSGDGGVLALADSGLPMRRPDMADPDQAVVGYASFAVWEGDNDGDSEDRENDGDCEHSGHAARNADGCARNTVNACTDPQNQQESLPQEAAEVLPRLARAALARYCGIDIDGPTAAETSEAHPWLKHDGACFVTLHEQGDLRGCIGSLEPTRPLGEDVACHTVDAACHDPRFRPVEPWEYPAISIEVSVLSPKRALPVTSRAQLEASLVPRRDGLVIDDGHGHRATFLPQVWDQLPHPHDFVGHLLAKAGLRADTTWNDARFAAWTYTVSAYDEKGIQDTRIGASETDAEAAGAAAPDTANAADTDATGKERNHHA